MAQSGLTILKNEKIEKKNKYWKIITTTKSSDKRQ